ncbi:MAG TPA: hypothetical protein VNW98_06725 [Burkholderiaceae bacterium]|jgi:hypothetical protein|nr:hypothetical protein [Burkholderiaceae bacterium]
MNRHRGDRKLHLELLRAHAAADRIELALALRDISDRLHPFRRAADAIGSVVDVLGGRSRALRWVAAAGAALARAGWVRQTLGAVGAGLRSGAVPRMRTLALVALAAGAVALLIRRGRRSEARDAQSHAGGGGKTV